jgi:opacity protein-like surface antigen
MKKALLGVLIASTILPGVAAAQVSLGVRAGYAIPAGDAYEASGFGSFKQNDLAKGAVALQVDASWRFSSSLSAGLYYGYGLGTAGSKLKTFCSTPGASCDSPTTSRYGVQAAYTLGLGLPIDPWIGVSAGLQTASFKVKNFIYGVNPFTAPPTPLVADLKGTLRGWEAGVEGGVDFRLIGPVVIGPFVSVGIGQYTVQDVSLSDQGKVKGGGVDTAKTHEWITLGLRGRFDI